jgi:hypothetical protein
MRQVGFDFTFLLKLRLWIWVESNIFWKSFSGVLSSEAFMMRGS